MVAKFLVLKSTNPANVGLIKQKESGTIDPHLYEISEEELNQFKAMSDLYKKAFIESKLSEKETAAIIATPQKKTVVVAEIEQKSDDSEGEPFPPIVEVEEINEPVSEIEKKQLKLYEKFDNHEKEAQVEALILAVENPKRKGRKTKNN